MKKLILILIAAITCQASDKSSDGRRTPDSPNSSVSSTISTDSVPLKPKKQQPRSWKNRRQPSAQSDENTHLVTVHGRGMGCC